LQVEHLEVSSFLAQHAPFDDLPPDARDALAAQVEVAYFRQGEDILKFGEPIQDLYVVRSGAVETFRRTGELYNRLAEGDIFGQMGLLMNRRVRFSVKAIEDTLVYCIPVEAFQAYCQQFETFADFFDAEDTAHLRQAVMNQADSNDLTTSRISDLIMRPPVCVDKSLPIREVAVVMTRERVSSLLIVDPDVEADAEEDDCGPVCGIVTDRDLRMRVLAADLPLDRPVHEVMSRDLVLLDHKAFVFEAMLTMLRHNLHHLPVMREGQAIGVIALSDIVRHESQSSLLLVRGILGQQTLDGLKAYASQVPAAFVRMVNEDANSHMIGTAMAVIGRSFKQALLAMAERDLGPPPVPYCFLALGSMARDEQLIVTDQDNAIILSDDYREEQHGAYFERMATIVSDGLAACGYPYCDGEVMATNPRWRLTRQQWQDCFADWMDNPDPQALLNCSIFFDLNGVWGKLDWARQLQRFIAQRAKGNKRFLASLSRNALNRTPPLGFFKGFVMEQDGQHRQSINLKRRGTAPLTDLIRVHALAVGSRAQNSFARLDDIQKAKILPPGKGQDLKDALEYIAIVRIRHQALAIQAGEEPDNNIQPDSLSSFERRNLKEAFQVVDKAQNFLKFAYNVNSPLK
jgi:CBS domain-containing protein